MTLRETLELRLQLSRAAGSVLCNEAIELRPPIRPVESGVELVIGGQAVSASTNVRQLYAEWGYDEVPAGFTVLVIPDRGVPPDRVHSLRARLKEDRGLSKGEVSVVISSVEKLGLRLGELESGAQPKAKAVSVLLLLPGRDSIPDAGMRQLMDRLDKCRVAWRRAYADDDQRWSVPDQVGSLLQAAGGRSHRVTVDGQPLPWAIGIDISHPANGGRSTVCAALTAPCGSLTAAWTLVQPRDEAVSAVTLRQLLLAATSRIRADDQHPSLVVLLDGRLFEKENAGFYRERLGMSVTLVEVRKGGNPPVFVDDEGAPPRQPFFGSVLETGPGRHVGFLVTYPKGSENGVDKVLKVHWRDEWDGLRLGSEGLPRLLYAMSVAPGLGLHRRTLPAPLYWADGIASAGGDSLKFRGQNVNTDPLHLPGNSQAPIG